MTEQVCLIANVAVPKQVSIWVSITLGLSEAEDGGSIPAGYASTSRTGQVTTRSR